MIVDSPLGGIDVSGIHRAMQASAEAVSRQTAMYTERMTKGWQNLLRGDTSSVGDVMDGLSNSLLAAIHTATAQNELAATGICHLVASYSPLLSSVLLEQDIVETEAVSTLRDLLERYWVDLAQTADLFTAFLSEIVGESSLCTGVRRRCKIGSSMSQRRSWTNSRQHTRTCLLTTCTFPKRKPCSLRLEKRICSHWTTSRRRACENRLVLILHLSQYYLMLADIRVCSVI